MAVTVNNTVTFDITPCTLVAVIRVSNESPALKMKVIGTFTGLSLDISQLDVISQNP